MGQFEWVTNGRICANSQSPLPILEYNSCQHEKWTERDFLVLRAAVLLCDEVQGGSVVVVSDIAERTGLAIQDVDKAIDHFKHEHLIIRAADGTGNTIILGRPTPLGLVVSGEWPKFTESLTEIVQNLRELEKDEKDPSKKAIVMKTLEVAVALALQLGVSVTANQVS